VSLPLTKPHSRFNVSVGLLGASLLFGSGGLGCGADERAPLLKASHAHGGAGSTVEDGGLGGADDSDAGDVSPRGIFDPARVYLMGTLGLNGAYVVADLETPDSYLGWFPMSGFPLWLITLHGSDLYYVASIGTRRFEPEVSKSSPPGSIQRSDKPAKNDPLLPTPPCDGKVAYEGADGPVIGGGALANLTSPDENFIYSCPDQGWFEAGVPILSGDLSLWALGHDRLAMTHRDNLIAGYGVMNLDTKQIIEVPAITDTPAAVRASVDGFHVVLATLAATTLLAVHADGSVATLGTYPGYGTYASISELKDAMRSGVLTQDDWLYQVVKSSTEYIVLRRTIAGESEVVYSTTEGHNVDATDSRLITGP
jgi:hypothetical protein